MTESHNKQDHFSLDGLGSFNIEDYAAPDTREHIKPLAEEMAYAEDVYRSREAAARAKANRAAAAADKAGMMAKEAYVKQHPDFFAEMGQEAARRLVEVPGTSVDVLAHEMNFKSDDFDKHFETLLSAGADIDDLVDKMSKGEVLHDIKSLLLAGADPERIVNKMDYRYIESNIEELITVGLPPESFLHRLLHHDRLDNLDIFNKHGVNIDKALLLPEHNSYESRDYIEKILAAGVPVDELVSRLSSFCVLNVLDILTTAGAHIDVNHLIVQNEHIHYSKVNKLLELGASVQLLLAKIHKSELHYVFDDLLGAGASVEELLAAGAHPHDLARHISSAEIMHNIDVFIEAGVDRDFLLSAASSKAS